MASESLITINHQKNALYFSVSWTTLKINSAPNIFKFELSTNQENGYGLAIFFMFWYKIHIFLKDVSGAQLSWERESWAGRERKLSCQVSEWPIKLLITYCDGICNSLKLEEALISPVPSPHTLPQYHKGERAGESVQWSSHCLGTTEQKLLGSGRGWEGKVRGVKVLGTESEQGKVSSRFPLPLSGGLSRQAWKKPLPKASSFWASTSWHQRWRVRDG